MLRLTPNATAVLLVALLPVISACDRKSSGTVSGESGEEEAPRDPVTGLTELESQQILATVGESKITLGDYAQSLARMDRFERLRYQSEERQRELLNEMVEMEILAQEARRRGLDRDPHVQLHMMQALRNEVLDELRRELPAPEELSESEVKDYYEAHRSDFVEPERRRVLVIETKSENAAKLVSAEAQGATGEKWAELARKHSVRRDRLQPGEANELAGDLGFVSAPGQQRGDNERVPEAVRKAVFLLEKVGDVSAQPLKGEGSYFVVRLGAISVKRDRSLRDAGPAIRAELLRLRFAEAEKKLLAELEKRYPATVDETALARAAEKRKTSHAEPASVAPSQEPAQAEPVHAEPARESEPQPTKPSQGGK